MRLQTFDVAFLDYKRMQDTGFLNIAHQLKAGDPPIMQIYRQQDGTILFYEDRIPSFSPAAMISYPRCFKLFMRSARSYFTYTPCCHHLVQHFDLELFKCSAVDFLVS